MKYKECSVLREGMVTAPGRLKVYISKICLCYFFPLPPKFRHRPYRVCHTTLTVPSISQWSIPKCLHTLAHANVVRYLFEPVVKALAPVLALEALFLCLLFHIYPISDTTRVGKVIPKP